MNRSRRGIAAAIIGIASAGALFVSAGAASADTWIYVGTYHDNQFGSGSIFCDAQGEHDESIGAAASYYCQNNGNGSWGLFEYVNTD